MTAADPGEATQTFTFSIPGLGGGIEISGVSSSGDTQEGAGGGGRGRVAISIPGGLGTLLGGSSSGGVIDDFFGLGGDSDTAAGGVSVSFNFPSGAESLGSLGSILGGGEGGGGIFGSDNTPFGLNGFFLDSDSSSSSFSDFNALFGSRPRTTTPSPLGDFSELSGGPWTQ